MLNLLGEHKGHRLFVLLGLITVVLASAMVFTVMRFRAYSRKFANTHEVLNVIVSLEASAMHAESSARAFLLTGDEGFHKEFTKKRAETENDEQLLAELQAGDIDEPHFLELSAAVSHRMERLAELVALRTAGASVATITSTYGEEAKRLAGAIGTLITEAKAEEGRLLSDRRVRRHQIEVVVLTLCGIGALVSISLVLVGIKAMRNDLRLRNEAQEDLRKANAELEQRVLDRTATIQQANEVLNRSQAELSEIAKALKRSNAELESFAYAATHDLQEPLRTVTLFAQLLQKERKHASPSDVDLYLGTIVKAADRMAELIQGVLEHSRVTRAPVEPSQLVDLNEVQAVVTANLAAQICESGAEIAHSHLPTLTADRLQLIRLMQNLVGNSLKYRSPERKCRIDVDANRQGDFWTISVHDNGVGFKPEYQQYIFGMFKRLDRVRAGAGVGLATCQTIVERFGGRIWAEAEEGNGATFYFTWPVAQSELAMYATR